MTADLINYITHYAYFAIFSLVFLQEIGIPNPVPNEFVLLFSGYLTYTGKLSFSKTILTVIAADFIGTLLLYIVFYFFGREILEHKPKWLPINKENINKLSDLISGRGFWGIYLGRLIPYVRGYTSVVSGLLEIRPASYISMVVLSAITWSGGYVLAGHLLGPEWQKAMDKFRLGQNIVLAVLVFLIIFFSVRFIYKQVRNQKKIGA